MDTEELEPTEGKKERKKERKKEERRQWEKRKQ